MTAAASASEIVPSAAARAASTTSAQPWTRRLPSMAPLATCVSPGENATQVTACRCCRRTGPTSTPRRGQTRTIAALGAHDTHGGAWRRRRANSAAGLAPRCGQRLVRLGALRHVAQQAAPPHVPQLDLAVDAAARRHGAGGGKPHTGEGGHGAVAVGVREGGDALRATEAAVLAAVLVREYAARRAARHAAALVSKIDAARSRVQRARADDRPARCRPGSRGRSRARPPWPVVKRARR